MMIGVELILDANFFITQQGKRIISYILIEGKPTDSYLEENLGPLAGLGCFAEVRRNYGNSHLSSFLDAQTCIDL